MLKKALIIIISVTLSWFVVADQLTLQKNAPKSYVVKKGDTLWDISGVFLKQPWLWPKLWRLNPEVSNPHLIYPGDELRLVFDAQGQPMLVKGKPAYKWSPKARVTQKERSPVETLPLNVIAPYISYDTVMNASQIEALPYIIGSDEGHKSSVDGFLLYTNFDLKKGQSYAIYQKGEQLIDPVTEDSLGIYLRFVGTAKTIEIGDANNQVPSTLYLENSKREVRSGDVIVPVNEGQRLPAFYSMQSASTDIDAAIIQGINNSTEFGKLDTVLINQGATNGVNMGDLFTIARTSPGVLDTADGPEYTKNASLWSRLSSGLESDYKMPQENIGKLMIFQTFDKVSMALVLNSTKPIKLNDSVIIR